MVVAASLFGMMLDAAAVGPVEREYQTLPAGLKSHFATLTEPVGKKKHRYDICVHNVSDGNPPGFKFTFRLLGPVEPLNDTDNNGGHVHGTAGNTDSRPVGEFRYRSTQDRTIGPVQVSTLCADPLDYLVPEFSGKNLGELFIELPTGWRTVVPQPADDTYTSWRYLDTIDVGMPGLSPLPRATDGSYEKTRNGGENHADADAFSIREDARANLEAIAYWYKLISGGPLSINDISLPRGGRFDWQADWGTSHDEHRYGTEADINRLGTNCEDNHVLRGIVLGLMPDRKLRAKGGKGSYHFGRLLCESGGLIHINLELVPIP